MWERIETLMDEYGYSASDLAKELGINRSAISLWKTGRSKPSPGMLASMANLFGVTVGYLKGTEESKGYYINPETAKKAQELFEKPGMRILFDAAQDASPEDLQAAADILILLKKKGHID